MTMKYTTDDIDAMLCAWEAMIDLGARYAGQQYILSLRKRWEDEGTVEMRSMARSIGPLCERVWQALKPDFREEWAFDWEIVPEIIGLLDWQAPEPWNRDERELAKLVTKALGKKGSRP